MGEDFLNQPKPFEIRPSGEIGRGLFATKRIPKGSPILEFKGTPMSLQEVLEKDMGGYPLQIGPTEYLEVEEPGVLANHSCSPNAGVKNDQSLVAITDILQDQEICFDYSTTMDDGWTMECKCQNPNCRHTIKDFKELPPEIQASYLELNIVQSFIKKQLLAKIA